MMVLGLCALAGAAYARTPRPWLFEASAAPVLNGEGWFDGSHQVASGAAWNATVGRKTLPWLAITGDVGVLTVTEAYHPAGAVGGATHFPFMTGVRFDPIGRFLAEPLARDRCRPGLAALGPQPFGRPDARGGMGLVGRIPPPRRGPRVGPHPAGHGAGGPVLLSTLGFGIRY
jgi:hypothetical protein